ncbi:MAG: sigma-70 family RNA polymerase sigma factor [Spirochaetales bacterium]|nr:sigma-70 family RNA polymerase sigma factor [Spirochaetales bacterium]
MEQELIIKAKSGNQKAFEKLTKKYLPKIYRAAYFFVHNLEDASDMCQETFLRAYKHIHRFDERRSFYTWIYTIMKNLSINHSKRSKKHQAGEAVENCLPDTLYNPEVQAMDRENNDLLLRGIENLPPMFREILVMKTYNDMSYQEMADALDIPIGTVMSRLYTARTKLKELIASLEGGK